jgi:hypothetical protein
VPLRSTRVTVPDSRGQPPGEVYDNTTAFALSH